MARVRQLQFEFRTWGGRRAGAGRPPKGQRAGVSHLRRPVLSRHHPVHVTLKIRRDLPRLRRKSLLRVLRGAFEAGRNRFGFRLVHFSVQADHVHLKAPGTDLTFSIKGIGAQACVGLRNIPDELLEAAELDGATPWQRLIYVVIPLMKPIILFTVIIATIIFFNVFAPVYVLTASAQGAPAYDLKVVIGEIYQNAFVFYRMGYAGAQSVVLLLFVLTLVFIQFTLFRDKAAR